MKIGSVKHMKILTYERVKWRLEIGNPRRNMRKKMGNMKEVDICSLLNWEAHL